MKAFLTVQARVSCPLCKEPHDLDDCSQFKEKTMREKKDFLFKSKLCFACYSSEHQAKECKDKRTCNICGSTLRACMGLHSKGISNTRTRQRWRIVHSIVLMYHSSCPEKKFEVYAMLDECSTRTFIHESLVDYLDEKFKQLTEVTPSPFMG